MDIARNILAATPGVEGPVSFPLDFPWAVSRRLNETRPRAIIFIDTEIWPNLISKAADRRVPLFLANGRISDKSFTRYRAIRWYLKPLLEKFTLFWMQSELNAERIRVLGAPPDRVRVAGNLKIDSMSAGLASTAASPQDKPQAGPPLFLAVSTHSGEEEILLAAAKSWRDRNKSVRLAIAPRHPERAKTIGPLIESFGFHPILRSAERNKRSADDPAWPKEAGAADVLLIDTIGEMSRFYPLADAVFVGGSLVSAGGHNIFEPAAFGRPILFGPHMENFREAEEILSGHGAIRVQTADRLAAEAELLLFDRQKAVSLGETARSTFRSLQGAADRIAAELSESL